LVDDRSNLRVKRPVKDVNEDIVKGYTKVKRNQLALILNTL